MSLVAYDSSDDEKDEEIVSSQTSQFNKSISEKNLSAKRQRECVKITIPSLKEFEEEECPVALKKPKFQPGSGLFSLLPPPKNSSVLKKPGFVPYILSSKKSNKEASHSVLMKCTAKPSETESFNSGMLEEQNYDETACNNESSKDKQNSDEDFFSLRSFSSDNNLSGKSCLTPDYSLDNNISDVPETSNIIQDRSSILSSNHPEKMRESIESQYMKYSQFPQEEVPNCEQVALVQHDQLDPSVNPYINLTDSNDTESLLSDKEFLKLRGRRREFESVDIIDVNADDQLTDRNEWLLKSLTEESTHRPSRKKHNLPTQQQKRKHQITYLAFQAKEREMDLKNQWALNSRTRRETQAKYGF